MNRNKRLSRNIRRKRSSRKQLTPLRQRNRRMKRKSSSRKRYKNKRRSRNRQRGGYSTTSVSPNQTEAASNSNNAVSSGQDCNLRNDANIFQSTFNNIVDTALPNIDNYLLVNNDVYVTQ